MAGLARIHDELQGRGAHVLGVSCDSRVTLQAWKKAMGYPVRLVSDFWPHGQIGRAYGAFDERLGVHTRTTVLIGPDGAIREVVSSEIARPRAVEHYLDALDRAQTR